MAVLLLAEHDNKARSQMIDGVLDATQAMIVDHVACYSDHE